MFFWLKKPVTTYKTPLPGYRSGPQIPDLEPACPTLFVLSYSYAMTTTWGDNDVFSTEKTRNNLQNFFQDTGAPPKTRIWSVRVLRSLFRRIHMQWRRLEVIMMSFRPKKNRHNSQKSISSVQERPQNPGFEIFHECVVCFLCYALFVCNDDDFRWW